MVSKKTRKSKQQKSKAMTIPELKRAFDKVESSISRIRSLSASEQIKEFQKVWRETFGKELEKSAAEAYLKVKFSEKPKRGTRKMKKMMKGGGAPLAGAPIDYQTRPGIDGPSVSYPAYLSAGLAGYDKFNQFAYKADCGVKDITPSLPAGLGSNQAGGAVQSTIPSSVFQDIQTAYSGAPLPASPAPEDSTWKYM
jgi:hypothetical protein